MCEDSPTTRTPRAPFGATALVANPNGSTCKPNPLHATYRKEWPRSPRRRRRRRRRPSSKVCSVVEPPPTGACRNRLGRWCRRPPREAEILGGALRAPRRREGLPPGRKRSLLCGELWWVLWAVGRWPSFPTAKRGQAHARSRTKWRDGAWGPPLQDGVCCRAGTQPVCGWRPLCRRQRTAAWGDPRGQMDGRGASEGVHPSSSRAGCRFGAPTD